MFQRLYTKRCNLKIIRLQSVKSVIMSVVSRVYKIGQELKTLLCGEALRQIWRFKVVCWIGFLSPGKEHVASREPALPDSMLSVRFSLPAKLTTDFPLVETVSLFDEHVRIQRCSRNLPTSHRRREGMFNTEQQQPCSYRSYSSLFFSFNFIPPSVIIGEWDAVDITYHL